MKKIIDLIKELDRKKIEKIILIAVFIVLGIIFYSYSTNLTWDSTEYIGLADLIGANKMRTDWIGHRGIGFPLLIKISQIFGKTSFGLLTLMFLFYSIMLISLYLIYKKLRKNNFLKNPLLSIIYLGFSVIIIALNPIIFGYYHTALTELVGISLAILACVLSWSWIDYSWKENRKELILTVLVLAIATILVYHVKQSLIVFVVVPILVSAVISIFDNFSYQNIVSKLVSILLIVLALMISIKTWGNYMTFTSFSISQVLKFIALLVIGAGIFTLISVIGIKFSNKYNLGKVIANTTRIVIILAVCAVGVLGYNHYKLKEEPIFPCDFSNTQRVRYFESYYASKGEIIAKEETKEQIANEETEVIQGVDVLNASNSARFQDMLVCGVFDGFYASSDYVKEWSKVNTYKIPGVVRDCISYEDNYEMDRVLNETSEKYSSYIVFKDYQDYKYFVYFINKGGNTLKDQINFYLKMWVNYPEQVLSSYKNRYWRIIYVKEGEFSPYDRENYNIPSKIYQKDLLNLVDYNPAYKDYAESYIHGIDENFVTKSLNWYMNKAIFVLLYKTETALWYAPIMLILVTLIYIILRVFFSKKISKEKLSLLQFVIILYATSFFGIMSYIVMGMSVERYTIPGQVPVLIAYFLIGMFVLEILIDLAIKIYKVITSKTSDKKTIESKA